MQGFIIEEVIDIKIRNWRLYTLWKFICQEKLNGFLKYLPKIV